VRLNLPNTEAVTLRRSTTLQSTPNRITQEILILEIAGAKHPKPPVTINA